MRPNSVCSFISCRTRSPADMCASPNASATLLAYVPLPTPGGPKNTTLAARRGAAIASSSLAGDKPASWASRAITLARCNMVESAGPWVEENVRAADAHPRLGEQAAT